MKRARRGKRVKRVVVRVGVKRVKRVMAFANRSNGYTVRGNRRAAVLQQRGSVLQNGRSGHNTKEPPMEPHVDIYEVVSF